MSAALLSERCRRWVGWRVRAAARLVVAGCTLTSLAAQAAPPDVRFDAPFVVSCRDVTPEEFAASNPHHRLVEARFEISALLPAGAAPHTLQYLYRFISPTGSLQIADYGPRTSQATPLAGNVSVERQQERSHSLGASLAGGWQPFAQGTANADRVDKSTAQIRYELKPPREVTLVAGTLQRGTGVYFKLFPSADTVGEGSRDFVIVMRVARDWRGDIMYVRCEAQQDQRGRLVSRGVSRFVVGLHAAGDDAARTAAENLNLAELTLRHAVAQRQQEIARRAMPTVVHRVGALLDMYDPRIPDTWLERLVYGPADLDQYGFVDHLPDDVRRLADHYAQAKRSLCECSGRRLSARQDPLALGAR